MLPELADALRLPFRYRRRMDPPVIASADEVTWDWNRLMTLPTGRSASFYRAIQTFVCYDEIIVELKALTSCPGQNTRRS